jgi:hypothetical protein
MDFDEAYADINAKKAKYDKRIKKYLFCLLLLFIFFFFFPIIINHNLLLWGVYLIVNILLLILVLSLWSSVQAEKLDISEKLVLVLIPFIKKYREYIEDPTDEDRLKQLKKYLENAIILENLSLYSYKRIDLFDTRPKQFVVRFRDYLDFNVENSLIANAKKQEKIRIEEDLKDIIGKIYTKDFDGASKVIERLNIQSSKKSYSESVKDFFLNTSKLSFIFSSIILLSLFGFLYKKYSSSIINLQELGIIISIIGVLGGVALFKNLKEFIKKSLDYLFDWIFELKSK